MKMRLLAFMLVAMILSLSGCSETTLVPVPGADEDKSSAAVSLKMLEFMEKESEKNRAERKENREAWMKFFETQLEENRAFTKGVLNALAKNSDGVNLKKLDLDGDSSSGLADADSGKSDSDTKEGAEEKPLVEKDEQPAKEEVVQTAPIRITDLWEFTEKVDLEAPSVGNWDPEADHVDPKSLTKVNLDDYPVFPNEDAGADPSVPAEMGGKGFGAWATDNGWKTNTSFPLMGDPNAKKGGEIVRSFNFPSFPDNLRPMGRSHNTSLNYFLRSAMWDTLLERHFITKEWCPKLATHWKHSEDGKTHYFRLNPNATWNDGSPVTTDDVLASYDYWVHPDLEAPMSVEVWKSFNRPEKISKYIFSITEREHLWINWDRIANSFFIFPKKELDSIEPKEFNEKYNYYPMMGSGPYTILPGGIESNKSLEIVRKKDWWGNGSRLATGLYNFDKMRWILVMERTLELEKLRKGDIDMMLILTSKLWTEKLNYEEIQKGWIQKRRIFNHEPQGTSYIAMNMEKEPFDSWEMRRAFAHLFPFEEISNKLMYNAYLRLYSYYPAGPYENPDNPKIKFDKQKALEYLARAGYQERDPESGLLVNEDGEPLKVVLTYRSPGLKPHMEIFQKACSDVGISLTLQMRSGATAFRMAQQREYQMFYGAWGATEFPVPDTSWRSTLKKGSNNITGLKSEKIDKLIDEYNKEFDIDKRITIMQDIDRELVEITPYILTWYGPFQRLLWWNKFSYPAGVVHRYEGFWYSSFLWWYDEEKVAKLEEARKNNTALLVGGVDNEFWNNFRDWQAGKK